MAKSSKASPTNAASPVTTPASAVQTTKSNNKPSPDKGRKSGDHIAYKVRLLDSEQPPLEVSISKNDNGDVLFNKVCEELGGIVERDYFGLRYMDKHNQRQWLDLGRNVKKQLVGAHSTALSFRVKHYPGNPLSDFHQEISQYLLYLQIRRDLVQGRLLCPLTEVYTLGALILQSEHGDAPDEDSLNGHDEGSAADAPASYFKNFRIIFNQTKKMEAEIEKQHETLRGLTARDAEVEVLKRASKLPTYGVDPFPVKLIKKDKVAKKGSQKNADGVSAKTLPTGDINANSNIDAQSAKSAPTSPGGAVYLGLRHTGLTTYVGLQPSENYNWNDIGRLACDGKDFIVYMKPESACDDDEPEGLKKKAKRAKPQAVVFRCETKAAALALWKWTVDRQSFFTLQQASEAKTTKTTNKFFRRSHSYRFIGKSQMELKSITSSPDPLPQPAFVRVSSLRRTPKGPDGELDPLSGRSTLPARIRSGGNTASDIGTFPVSDPVKRPGLSAVSEQIQEAMAPQQQTVINVTKDLIAPAHSETPLKAASSSEAADVIVPAVTSEVNAAPSTGKEAHLRQRSGASASANRDSEMLRAVKEIDQAINSVHRPNGPVEKKQSQPNGEAVREVVELISSSSSPSRSSSNSVIVYAVEAAVFIGVVCFAVMVAALETRPGGQSDTWATMASRLRGTPFVASFNEYFYGPVRGRIAGLFTGGH